MLHDCQIGRAPSAVNTGAHGSSQVLYTGITVSRLGLYALHMLVAPLLRSAT